MKLKNAHTKIVDLGGKTMLPGFVEPHAHTSSGYMCKWTDLSPFVNEDSSAIRQKIIKVVKECEEMKPKQNAMFQLYDPLITPVTAGEQTLAMGMKDLDKYST